MRTHSAINLAVSLTFLVACNSQSRYTDGQFKGFSKPNVEIVNWHGNEPIRVRSVKGTIRRLLGTEQREVLEGVVFEIRGPGSSDRVRGAKTNARGEFRLAAVPAGTYTFKTTLEGYQSIAGILIVSSSAPRNSRLDLAIPLAF